MIRAREACRSPDDAGFTLIEMTLVLAIISLIAVLALPRVSFSGGATSLRIKGYEVAAMLRADRDEAIRSGQPVITYVDLVNGRLRSSTVNGEVVVPTTLFLRASGAALDGIRFMPDGSASGGEIFLMRTDRTSTVAVRINPLTGAIDLDRGASRDE